MAKKMTPISQFIHALLQSSQVAQISLLSTLSAAIT